MTLKWLFNHRNPFCKRCDTPYQTDTSKISYNQPNTLGKTVLKQAQAALSTRLK